VWIEWIRTGIPFEVFDLSYSLLANRSQLPSRWQGDARVDFIEEFRPERSYRYVSVNSGGSMWSRTISWRISFETLTRRTDRTACSYRKSRLPAQRSRRWILECPPILDCEPTHLAEAVPESHLGLGGIGRFVTGDRWHFPPAPRQSTMGRVCPVRCATR
jgi:hypothetical protein